MSNPQYLSGQPDKRRPQRFTDQHGRKWSGIIEVASGLPTGPIAPDDFSPPLEVPQEFIRYDKLEPNSVRIDYAAWIASLEDAKRRWERKLVDRAQTLYGEQAGKYIKAPSPELLNAVGAEPQPVEPVQAAASGNRWVLGLTPIKPKWAEKFYPSEAETSESIREGGRLRRDLSDVEKVWAERFPDEEETPAKAGKG